MFKHQVVSFGKYEKHIFQHASGKALFSLVPACGACLLDLVLEGKQIIDSCKTPVEASLNNWAKSSMLFPFPNRLRNGRYEWGGEILEFPVNDPATGTALHGLGIDKDIELIGYEIGENEATAVCQYQSKGEFPYYPFPFTFSAVFKVEYPGQFTITLAFRNDGDRAIPAGLGWHPYFHLGFSDVKDMELQMPACELVGIDAAMIPTGKRYGYDDFVTPQKIGTTVLDNCFALIGEGETAETLLRQGSHQLRFWQETGPGKYNFLQVFTPPHRNSIAVEPMTCNIDAFNNGEGLAVLEPGSEIRARFGVDFRIA
ncbi:MAG: hypothetical protein HUU01_09920 [Saprospiraceae bacterium]|nr:hypothetical protein [Saprospiraceae bacterium]